MRGSIIIFITIILLGIGIYYVWQKGIPQGWAKGKIINKVESRLNGKLKIKSIHFKFPNQAILQGIKLVPDKKLSTPIVEIKEIVCKYNLIAPIIHFGRFETGVSKIVVIEPSIDIYRDKAGNWNFASLFKPQPKPQETPPATTILVKKAKLKIKDEIFGTQTTLSKIYVSYYPQGPPPYFHVRMGHQVNVSGNIYKISPLEVSFNLKIIKKDLSCYAGFLKTQWANLLQGQISGILRGKIQNKKISLDTGNLSINEGVVKLTYLKYPITNITGNLSLLASRGLITDNVKFKFRDIDVTTQKFYMNDIFKNEAIIDFVTSEFYLKNLGDILPYLKKLNLKSVLKFRGGFDFSHSFSLFGEAELLNQTHTGYKFPILAKFKYKNKIFDHISLLIDKKTQIEGNLNIPKELNLKAKFDKSNLLPLLALSGRKELKEGTITGEIIVKGKLEDIQYDGDLKLEINGEPLFKELTAKLKGDKKSIVFTSQLVQQQGKIDIEGKGIRESLDQPFSLSLTSKLNKCNLFNRDVSANITFDGKLSTNTKLIGGQAIAENIIIDKNSYPNWQGSLFYDYPTLNISTSQEIKQLIILGKITFTEPITASVQIKTKDTNLAILTKRFKGRFDGEFNLKRTSRAEITISGESVTMNLADGRSLTGNFELTKMKDKVYIEHLILDEPQKMNMFIKGKVDLTYPQATFMELEGKIYKLKYKNLEFNTSAAEFRGYLSKSQLSGVMSLTDGKINNFLIDNGDVDFSYSDQRFAIRESGIVLGRGGILTTFGTFSTKGDVELKFSLLGMNYQDMPYDYFNRFKGEFDLIGEAWGNIENPIILASLESKGVTVDQHKIAKISGRINYSNHEFQIVHSKINGELSFTGTFSPKDKYLSGLIHLEGAKVTTFASLLSLPSKNLHGFINGEIETKGNLNNLGLKGEIEIENFHMPGFDATYGEIKFTLEDKTLAFQKLCFIQTDGGKVDFKKYQLELKPDGKIILTASMENLIIANITFDGKMYFTGAGTPWNKAKGILNTKNLLINQSDAFKILAVEICYENGLLEFLPLPKSDSLSGKIRFISNEKLEIKDIKILKAKEEKLKINGSVELIDRRCDLRFVTDNSELKILPLWFKEIKNPEGKVEGWLYVCGDFEEPQFNGALMITNGALTIFPFAKRVTKLQGQIRIVNNWFASNFLKAEVGKSILVMKSNLPFTLKNIDIELKSFHKPVPVSIPGFLEGSVDVHIQLKGDITSPIGSGNIRIVNARFTYPPKIIKTTNGKIRWENLMITTGNNVRYYNEYVDVRIKQKGSWIKVSREKDEIWADGIVYARAGGRVNYLGEIFTIKRAYLEFREGSLSPYLSGYAMARIGKRRIGLTYEGYIGEATPTLQALGGYPPMNEEQIVNALLGGKTEYTNLSSTDRDTILKLGFGQVIGKEIALTLLIPIEKQLSQLLLGMDVELKTSALERMFEKSVKNDEIDREKSTSIFAESEFKIGRFISEDVYISYRGILKPWEEEEFARLKLKQELELEYYISGNTSIKYKFVPEGVWRKGDEHEVMIERQVRF
ncbi:MAG: translocation/assembly module TamB domain-containing protein [bacterium]